MRRWCCPFRAFLIVWLLLCCHYHHDDYGANSLFSNAFLLQPLLVHRKKTHQRSSSILTSLSSSSKNDDSSLPLFGLRVAIVGGGPSGLLLSHRLLQSGASVNLYEKRPRPTIAPQQGEEEKEQQQKLEINNNNIESPRAYALGIGIRGRTAIKSVDQQLWQAVTTVGYASERFILHVGPFAIRLRDESDSIINKNDNTADKVVVEPILLLYQSDLCRILADELEQRWTRDDRNGRLSIIWNCAVLSIDLLSKSLVPETNVKHDFDLLVGCDGVNSVVRRAMNETFPAFETRQELIPGLIKVVKLSAMPPFMDPTAVQLAFPRSGGVIAFVEPTANGTCCVLFAGRDGSDVLLSSDNVTSVAEELEARFPKLKGADLQAAAQQMAQNKNLSQTSLVTCNIYHCGSTAVLVGDAAHATGSVSGQGADSALMDAAVLTDCLTLLYDRSHKQESLGQALLAFSQRAVPEGKALYDLSFGPWTALGTLQLALSSARDSIFKGRFGIGEMPLQTMLTTSLRSFSEIRRQRDRFYEEKFMDEASWNTTLAKLDTKLRNKELVA